MTSSKTILQPLKGTQTKKTNPPPQQPQGEAEEGEGILPAQEKHISSHFGGWKHEDSDQDNERA